MTSADTGRPLRRAQIRLTAPELSEPRTTSTNLQGIFELRDHPRGRQGSAYYAQSYFPGTASTPEAQRVKLAPGQEASGMDFGMAPGRAANIPGFALRAVLLRVTPLPVGWAIRSIDVSGKDHREATQRS